MYPQVTMLLIHLHLFSSISILNCAEKNRSETELMTAFRLMGSFYATGHAVGYVSLLSDLCMRLECMSDAEKKLWTLTLFRKSIHGKNIFADLFVEKFVFANKAMVGKKALSNNKERHFKGICEAALKTADESSEVRRLKMDVTREPTEGVIKSLSLGRRYCEWILYFRDLNLFGDGAIRKVKAVPFAKRKPATEYDEVTKFECCSLSGSVPSNPDSCFILSIGEKRNTAYVQTFLVDGDVHDSTRPESGDESVSLTMIDPLKNREQINPKKEAKRAVSEDLDYLQKRGIYKAPEVDVAIAQLKQQFENHE